MEHNYSKLFQPINIGSLQVNNRLVVPPMESGFASPEGYVTDRLIDYYTERARGGFGLIIVEITAIEPYGKGFQNQLCVYDDKYIPGLHRLVKNVQSAGAKIALQIYHPGRCANPAFNDGAQPIAPSPIPDPVYRYNPKELNMDEIENLVECFSQGARRAKEAGFDAVEIHGAHGYFISQFMSAYANKRMDEYGGDFEGFMRLPSEIIRRIRRLVGTDYPLSFRISAEEGVPQGRTVQESANAAKRLVKEGIDVIHVSVGVFESYYLSGVPPAVKQGFNAPAASVIKSAITVPVIVVGRINDPDIAEDIISSGKADLVSLGRQSIADPEWPNKVVQNRAGDIVQCLSCNDGCVDGLNLKNSISCVQNLKVGRERMYTSAGSPKSKHVLIAGGGPAGLEAARTAAIWGHKVTLFEKKDILGGQLLIAIIPPTKDVWKDVVFSRIRDIKRLGVKINLGKELTAGLVKKISPDVLIIATGSEPQKLNIPGINGNNVITAQEALTQPIIGNKVVIIGGGLVGCETADYLSQQGKDITIIEMLGRIARDVGASARFYLRRRLKENNVKILLSTTATTITEDGVVIKSEKGEQKLGPIDTIVIATGARSINTLGASTKGLAPKIYVIGDAARPGKVLDAVQQAAEIGRIL